MQGPATHAFLRPRARALTALAVAALFALGGCGRASDGGTDATLAHQAPAVTQAELHRLRADGPVATARRAAPADYVLHYRLMESTGMVKALGGQQQALDALQAIGNAYQRKAEALVARPPTWRPAAFTGEGMDAGFAGLGMASLGMMMLGGVTTGMVGQMSEAQIAELASQGPLKLGSQGNSMDIKVGQDSIEQTMEYTVGEQGLMGSLKVRARVDLCPDPQGKVTADLSVKSNLALSEKDGIGGFVDTQFKLERWLDDDARLIQTQDGSASEMHIAMSGSEHGQTQSADISLSTGRDGQTRTTEHGQDGFSIFRPDEMAHAGDLLKSAMMLLYITSESLLRQAPWESGRCVQLDVTSDPAKRSGARPNTAYTLMAIPRARSDKAPARGTVSASLSGASTLNPTGKVKADARFDYANPDKRDQRASIAFESRSKRGVGKATLDFDTMQGGYRITLFPGCPGFHGSGEVCDLRKPFSFQGKGGDCNQARSTMSFEPSDDRHGRYRWLTVIGSIKMDYSGSYTIETTEDGALIRTSASGCATGPGGRACGGTAPGIPLVRSADSCGAAGG